MASKKSPDSRHGKLSENTAQTSITMNKKLMEMAKAEAKKEGRSLSNWLEQLVKKGLPPMLIAFALFHLNRSPSDWSSKALLATGKAATVVFVSMGKS
jgi:hypothetical protein